jgi:hypothetical protein
MKNHEITHLTHQTHHIHLSHYNHQTHLTHFNSPLGGFGECGELKGQVGDIRANCFLSSRLSYFQQLFSICNDFLIWDEREKTNWQPISNFDLNELMKNTNLHREIFPNEWVFDLDGNDWPSVHNLALALESLLGELEIPFNRWSSGNHLHYHIFVNDSEIVQSKVEWYKKLIVSHFKLLKKDRISIEDVIELNRQAHRSIPLLLIEKLPKVENASIDTQKFTSLKCLIRAEGSLNLKTYAYKSYLPELPQNQPLIKASWHVKFPEKIAIWQPDVELYESLFLLAYEHYVKPEFKHEVKTRKKGKEIDWIENILQNTFHDGRKRLLDLVILPYLIKIKGLDPESAFSLAFNWALKNHNIEPIRINGKIASHSALKKYIQYRAKRVERMGFMPLSKNNLKKHFSDCNEILRIIDELR